MNAFVTLAGAAPIITTEPSKWTEFGKLIFLFLAYVGLNGKDAVQALAARSVIVALDMNVPLESRDSYEPSFWLFSPQSHLAGRNQSSPARPSR